MDVTEEKLVDLASQYQNTLDSDLLYQLGRVLLDESDAKDGKLLFMMRASVDQFNSSLSEPIPVPTFIGVYASTSTSCFSYFLTMRLLVRDGYRITLLQLAHLLLTLHRIAFLYSCP